MTTGSDPDGVRFEGVMDLSGVAQPQLPEGLIVDTLVLDRTPLDTLPPGIRARVLLAREAALQRLPPDLEVSVRLDLSGCVRLSSVPALRTGILRLCGCSALQQLPEGISVDFLDLSGCVALRELPVDLEVRHALDISGCPIETLPASIVRLSRLVAVGCHRLGELPEGLTVLCEMDLAGTAVRELPERLRSVPHRWQGASDPPGWG